MNAVDVPNIMIERIIGSFMLFVERGLDCELARRWTAICETLFCAGCWLLVLPTDRRKSSSVHAVCPTDEGLFSTMAYVLSTGTRHPNHANYGKNPEISSSVFFTPSFCSLSSHEFFGLSTRGCLTTFFSLTHLFFAVASVRLAIVQGGHDDGFIHFHSAFALYDGAVECFYFTRTIIRPSNDAPEI